MNLRKILANAVFGALLLLSSIVMAQDNQWELIDSDANNDSFLDRARITRQGEYAEAWVIIVPKQQDSEYNRGELLMSFGCSGPSQGTYVEQHIVAHHRATGSVISQDLDRPQKTIEPGSLADDIWRKVCE